MSSSELALPRTERWQLVWTLGWIPGLLLLLAAVMLFALTQGKYPITISQILQLIAHQLGISQTAIEDLDNIRNVLLDIRLPRILVAMLVGSALSTAGASFQAIFRNPLVSPSLLGVQSGAALGAALGMLLELDWATIQLMAFTLGLLAVALAVAIANIFGRQSIITLILGGMISSSLFASALAIIKYVADPYSVLPSIVYWMMGNLAQADGHQVLLMMPPMLLCLLLLCGCGKLLDALAMGDDEARSLGVPVNLVRYGVILLATLLSAMTVSIAGIIGWIGIIIPHLVRILLGPANRLLLPATAIVGAIFLILADLISRLITTGELPIGIVTELLGIPAFILVLHKARKGWN